MRTHHTATLLAALAVLAVAGCSSSPKTDAKPTASATAPTSPAGPGAADTAGAPPGPTGDKRVIYLATLNGIDPEIVNGKDDEAISRGRDQCTAMKDEKDPTKRVAQVEQRFTGPGHPNGFGPTKSALILATVQANICPTY
ncbi:DUF732 domain-containing protein [Streptomyces avidinii]|uniref:DUF732 domain-containing protein n=1 Tax=Streptomyces avidinii TaxID=1895 RepID=A0ABS4L6X6_STRAV|nr:hypothetical protein [Streptomyces avidinii]MBP2037874.1 hypothetical protein [Streptomyces avidinii]GGZ08049.1 hypothetical protein GCM10010343_37770 [Streptomyces avidinii]